MSTFEEYFSTRKTRTFAFSTDVLNQRVFRASTRPDVDATTTDTPAADQINIPIEMNGGLNFQFASSKNQINVLGVAYLFRCSANLDRNAVVKWRPDTLSIVLPL